MILNADHKAGVAQISCAGPGIVEEKTGSNGVVPLKREAGRHLGKGVWREIDAAVTHGVKLTGRIHDVLDGVGEKACC